eukprot:3755910-Rhodomonas_salina.1
MHKRICYDPTPGLACSGTFGPPGTPGYPGTRVPGGTHGVIKGAKIGKQRYNIPFLTYNLGVDNVVQNQTTRYRDAMLAI